MSRKVSADNLETSSDMAEGIGLDPAYELTILRDKLAKSEQLGDGYAERRRAIQMRIDVLEAEAADEADAG